MQPEGARNLVDDILKMEEPIEEKIEEQTPTNQLEGTENPNANEDGEPGAPKVQKPDPGEKGKPTTPEEIREKVKKLVIPEPEKKFIRIIAPLIGQTPRTLKRYLNIYRIIRTHDDTKNLSDNQLDELKAIMLLLAIVVGHGPIVKGIVEQLQSKDEMNFGEFIDSLDSNDFESSSSFDDFQNCYNKLKSDKTIDEKDIQEVDKIKIKSMIDHLGIVSRFSFRDIK